MNVETTMPPASRPDNVSPHPDEPTAARTRADRQPTSPGAADLLLVIATVAMVLGLSAVTASLTPGTAEVGDPQRNWAPIGLGRDVASATPPDFAEQYLAEPGATTVNGARGQDAEALPQFSAAGPWQSPLYPQNSVTLWDRIRVSAAKDRRALLLGTTIQIHAPESAATPGPRP